MSELPSEDKLAHSIGMKVAYMADGSIVVKCDCTVEFKFRGGDDFDHIVRPQLIAETLTAHVKTTHLPPCDIPSPTMADIVGLILDDLNRQLGEGDGGEARPPVA